MNAGPESAEVHRATKMDLLVNRVIAPLALIGGLLLIIFVTLNSFAFSFQQLSVAGYFTGFKFVPSSYMDFPLNIFLFVPFGFGLASMLDQACLSKKATVLIVLLTGFLLTWLVESLQHFLPGRTPNISDIMANALGALVGLALYRAWQNRQVVVAAVLTPQYLVFCLLIYLLLLSGLGIILRNRARLDDWGRGYRLLIGNEVTGDRPWAGNVRNLAFLDRALPDVDVQDFFLGGKLLDVAGESLVAYYPLQDAASLADQTGNLWDLFWIDESGASPIAETPQLDGRNWLHSEWAVLYLTDRLAATSQFTIMLSVSTADLQQMGPARIISVSINPHYRNLTLGQEGQDLIVRVRTPHTGLNGTFPEFAIPDVFVDQDPHNLVVTYDGLTVTVYVDDIAETYAVELVPGLAFFLAHYAPFRQTLTIYPLISTIYKVLFYLLAFIPVGFILALLAAQLRSHISRFILLIAGITLPALLLELLLTANNGHQLRLPNILFASAVTALSYLLLTPAARKLIASHQPPSSGQSPNRAS